MKKPSKNSPLSETVWLLVEDFEYLSFDFARKHLTFDEPIPHYSTRDNALLESALGSPSQSFGGKFLYPTLTKQAAILFYSLIKNHPFKNGNKRIAVMSLLTFLALNNKWLSMKPIELYYQAFGVSEVPTINQGEMLRIIENMLDKYLIPLPKSLVDPK